MVIGRDKPQPEKVDQNQVSNADFEFVTLNDQATEKIETPRYSYWRSVAKVFFANKLTIAMFVLMLIILLLAFIQPLFSGYSLMNVSNINDFGARYNWPSWHYWFGTDADGKSLFDAVWAGARTSISFGVIASLITPVIGVAIGAPWGNSKESDRAMPAI